MFILLTFQTIFHLNNYFLEIGLKHDSLMKKNVGRKSKSDRYNRTLKL